MELLNYLNISLLILVSIVTIAFYTKDEKIKKILYISSFLLFVLLVSFNFKEIIFYVSKVDINYQNIINFLFGFVVGFVGVGVVGVFSVIRIFGETEFENFIKNNYKKILFFILIPLLILIYFILDRNYNFTNKLFNYEYKNYLLSDINISSDSENGFKILNRVLELTDIDSIKKEDLKISIKTFALLSEYYQNSNDKKQILESLKKVTEIIIELINLKVDTQINPKYYFLDESPSIAKSVIQANREAIDLFDEEKYIEAKKIFQECISNFYSKDNFDLMITKKETFNSETDFSNFAKLNINLANTLFELKDFNNSLNKLNSALNSAYSSLYINNKDIFILYDKKLIAQKNLNLNRDDSNQKMRELINAIEKGIIKKEKIEKLALDKKKLKTIGDNRVISNNKNRKTLFYIKLNFANMLYNNGDYKEAIYFYNSALKFMPKQNHYFLIYIYNKMGLTYEKLNEIDNSIKSFELAKSYAFELGDKYPIPDKTVNIPYLDK